ncbi:hypothetical protein BH24GEM1_BH24GEM1_28010 [soil metagenome]
MDHLHVPDGGERAILGRQISPTDRRHFLKWSGAAAVTAMLVGCDRSPTEPTAAVALGGSTAASGSAGVEIDLKNDFGILNFAFALEQLEAAYYTRVLRDPYGGVTGEEDGILRDLKRHEVVHREFLKAALGRKGIPALAVDFSAVNFGSRASVLGTAQVFEDLGVAAYNGAAQFLNRPDFLFVAGKIVSVEARHAAAIRDVLGQSFAPQAFDPAFTFEQVLRQAAPFIATPITLANSPTAGHPDARITEEEMVS